LKRPTIQRPQSVSNFERKKGKNNRLAMTKVATLIRFCKAAYY